MTIPHSRPDFDRHRRQGFPEAVYCASKSPVQILSIADSFARRRHPVLFTRLEASVARQLRRRFGRLFRYHPLPKMGVLGAHRPRSTAVTNRVLIVTAGTSDIPVAEEAALTAEFILARKVRRLYDVGVAGLHRLLDNASEVQQASCIVVCAGMDGALPSVVGGLAPCPVIAVPTSVGYGVSADGRAALMAMLSSCASNVCTVNIDNGFSAGVVAALIAKTAGKDSL